MSIDFEHGKSNYHQPDADKELQPMFRSIAITAEQGVDSERELAPLKVSNTGEISASMETNPNDAKQTQLPQHKRLEFPIDRLYGREEELNILEESFLDILSDQNGGRGLASLRTTLISGRSGCGKTALVKSFVQRLHETGIPHLYMSGKFTAQNMKYPFLALTDAIDKWARQLSTAAAQKLGAEALPKLRKSLGDDSEALLQMMPSLRRLQRSYDGKSDNLSVSHRSLQSARSTSRASRCSSTIKTSLQRVRMNKARLNHMFQNFLQCISSPEQPLIFFIDDLQWADSASLDVLEELVNQRRRSQTVHVIGSYRSDEIHDEHPLQQWIDRLYNGTGLESLTFHLELGNLSENDVAQFIADTLSLDFVVAQELSNAMYTKTSGNINYTKQAMEELERQRALYFDPIAVTWRCTLSLSELQDAVSDSVLEAIKEKIERLPELVRQLLIVGSYVRNYFDVGTIGACMNGIGIDMNPEEIMIAMSIAEKEGLLVSTESSDSGDKEFAFAHDTVQEAASSFVFGAELEQLALTLGRALAEYGRSEEGKTWMLFAAAHHWNALRETTLWPQTDTDRLELARLNMDTASISITMAGFSEASRMLHSAIKCLDEDESWDDDYRMMMELCHLIMDTEYCLGNYDRVRDFIGKCLEHAHTMQDKGPAFVHSLSIIMQGKDRNHDLALKKGMAILSWSGIDIACADPANVDQEEILRAELECTEALRGRKVVDLTECYAMEDETILCIIERMAKAAIYSGKMPFAYLLGQVAIKICAKEEGISEYLPRTYMYSQMYFRKKGLNLLAYDCAVTCKALIDEITDASVEGYCTVTVTCNNGLQLLQPSRRAVDVYEECYTKSMRSGDTEFASLIANSYGMCFFFSGRALDECTEHLFASFEEESRHFNQPPSVFSIFMVYRQLCYNLRGDKEFASENMIDLNGGVMEEGMVLSRFELDTNPYKQTLRDISSCKLMAACIFHDLPVMEKCIQTLQTWPDFDVLLHRLNMRLVWQAFAAFELARCSKRGKASFSEIAKKYFLWYGENAKQGNPNAKAIYACLQAEQKQSKKNYNKAIEACREHQFLHLEAFMNEKCGRYQLSQKKIEKAQPYFQEAHRLYLEYGALGKTAQLERIYDFF